MDILFIKWNSTFVGYYIRSKLFVYYRDENEQSQPIIVNETKGLLAKLK